MIKLGPRVIFKDDRDSSIGRGCRLYSNHFVQHNMNIFVAAVGSFSKRNNISVIRITEGWRDIRNDRRDLHEECRAFDFTAEEKDGNRLSFTQYELVAADIRIALGSDYDVIVHGNGSNLHIHIEYDPKFSKKEI